MPFQGVLLLVLCSLSGRAASRSLGLSPFLNHMQKLNLSFTAKPGWYEPDHPLIM